MFSDYHGEAVISIKEDPSNGRASSCAPSMGIIYRLKVPNCEGRSNG